MHTQFSAMGDRLCSGLVKDRACQVCKLQRCSMLGVPPPVASRAMLQQ